MTETGKIFGRIKIKSGRRLLAGSGNREFISAILLLIAVISEAAVLIWLGINTVDTPVYVGFSAVLSADDSIVPAFNTANGTFINATVDSEYLAVSQFFILYSEPGDPAPTWADNASSIFAACSSGTGPFLIGGNVPSPGMSYFASKKYSDLRLESVMFKVPSGSRLLYAVFVCTVSFDHPNDGIIRQDAYYIVPLDPGDGRSDGPGILTDKRAVEINVYSFEFIEEGYSSYYMYSAGLTEELGPYYPYTCKIRVIQRSQTPFDLMAEG